MPRWNFLLAVAGEAGLWLGVVALCVVAQERQAQQTPSPRRVFGGGPSYGGMGGHLLTLAGNEVVQRELGIGPDTSGQMRALREQFLAHFHRECLAAGIDFTAIPQEEEAVRQQAELIRAIDERVSRPLLAQLESLLTAEQWGRLKQILIQSQGVGALTSNPEVASALALSEDQRQRLAELRRDHLRRQQEIWQRTQESPQRAERLRELDRECQARMLEVLTDAQRQHLTDLRGRPFDWTAYGQSESIRLPRGLHPTGPASWHGVGGEVPLFSTFVRLAAHEAVQQDLGVTAEVAAQLRALQEEYLAARRRAFEQAGVSNHVPLHLPPAERQKALQKLAQIEEQLYQQFKVRWTSLLAREQLVRLNQIRLQRQGALALMREDEVRLKLAPTRDQFTQFSEILREFQRIQEELLYQPGRDPRGQMDKLEAAIRERDAKLLAVLTDQQRQTFQEMLGRPFDVSQLDPGPVSDPR